MRRIGSASFSGVIREHSYVETGVTLKFLLEQLHLLVYFDRATETYLVRGATPPESIAFAITIARDRGIYTRPIEDACQLKASFAAKALRPVAVMHHNALSACQYAKSRPRRKYSLVRLVYNVHIRYGA